MDAEIARNGLGQQPTTEAIIMTATHDSQNQTLDASTGNNYTIALSVPLPAYAFWSLTLYNASSFLFVDNPINRYSIGDHVSSHFWLPYAYCTACACRAMLLHVYRWCEMHTCPLNREQLAQTLRIMGCINCCVGQSDDSCARPFMLDCTSQVAKASILVQ